MDYKRLYELDVKIERLEKLIKNVNDSRSIEIIFERDHTYE